MAQVKNGPAEARGATLPDELTLQQELAAVASRVGVEKLEQALYFPKFFQIETTRRCNARCPFCPSKQSDKTTPFMSDELFERIVAELAQYADWIECVMVQRLGEPLTDPQIAARIQRLKAAGISRVSLSTNASLLDETMARSLIGAGLDEIMFSIDSIHKEEYERMRVGLSYERVVANIKRFFRLRDEIRPGMQVRVRGVSFHDLEKEDEQKALEEWEDFWRAFASPHDRVYKKRAHNWGNQWNWEGRITPGPEILSRPCVVPWSTFHVTTKGKVPLCPQDYDGKITLGDLNCQSIAEVWQGEGWEEIRRLHRQGRRNQIPLCRGCVLFDLEYSLEKEARVAR